MIPTGWNAHWTCTNVRCTQSRYLFLVDDGWELVPSMRCVPPHGRRMVANRPRSERCSPLRRRLILGLSYRNKAVFTGIGCNLINPTRCTFVAAAIRSLCRSGGSGRGCTGLHGSAVSPVYRLAFTLWWGGSSVQVKFRLGGAQRSHCLHD